MMSRMMQHGLFLRALVAQALMLSCMSKTSPAVDMGELHCRGISNHLRPAMLLPVMRLKGGISIGQLVKNNNVEGVDEDLWEKMLEAADAGESTENWTSDSSQKEMFRQ
jgi:hypothetical protein